MVLCTSPLLCLSPGPSKAHLSKLRSEALGEAALAVSAEEAEFPPEFPSCVFAPLQSRDKTRPFHLLTAPHKCTCPAMKQQPLLAVEHTPAPCLFLTLTLPS